MIPSTPETDWELLRDYAVRGSGKSFAELVSRYVDLVHSAATRQLHDPHEAEDVAQAVFMILARKAGSLSPNVILSAWLLSVTRYACANARRMATRRAFHERKAGEVLCRWREDQSDWGRLSPLLDDAIDRLPRPDREAVVLRFFERKSMRGVANALGIKEEAAKKRVSRAVDKLRLLAHRGQLVTPGSCVLPMLLMRHCVERAPDGLASHVAWAAMAGSESAMTAPLFARSIADSASLLMAWQRTRLAACAALLAFVLGGPYVLNGLLARPSSSAPPVEAARQWKWLSV